jgi:hypothetical protein
MMRMNTVLRMFGLFLLLLVVAAKSQAQIAVGISVGFAPPALPVYEQPICPADGYIWTPGYWAWDPDAGDYYWVPGTWVLAPQVGFLWTPAWWGWEGGHYFFHGGFWGPTIGFYGGINYGFGYFGHGYEGGRWDGGHFFYNRTVNNVNVTVIHNTYNTTINNVTVNHVSYNGGQGGIQARATAQEEAAARGEHVGPVAAQEQHIQEARNNRELRASVNQGKPPIAATERPGAFTQNATPAREAGGRYEAPANRGAAGGDRPPTAEARPGAENRPAAGEAAKQPVHVTDLPAHEHMTAPNTGNQKLDQKYQQQQDKLYAKQEQQRQKLQQQQQKEDQRAQQAKANQQRQQQVEQRHQQQTQHLQQQHAQQTQHLQERQSGGGGGAHPPAPHH